MRPRGQPEEVEGPDGVACDDRRARYGSGNETTGRTPVQMGRLERFRPTGTPALEPLPASCKSCHPEPPLAPRALATRGLGRWPASNPTRRQPQNSSSISSSRLISPDRGRAHRWGGGPALSARQTYGGGSSGGHRARPRSMTRPRSAHVRRAGAARESHPVRPAIRVRGWFDDPLILTHHGLGPAAPGEAFVGPVYEPHWRLLQALHAGWAALSPATRGPRTQAAAGVAPRRKCSERRHWPPALPVALVHSSSRHSRQAVHAVGDNAPEVAPSRHLAQLYRPHAHPLAVGGGEEAALSPAISSCKVSQAGMTRSAGAERPAEEDSANRGGQAVKTTRMHRLTRSAAARRVSHGR